LIRVIRNRAYLGTLPERLGFLPAGFQQSSGGAIWVHAVSVGEVMAAGTLMGKLR
jgi:3-deoxy-D-manno-octulosonic-acid transferase